MTIDEVENLIKKHEAFEKSAAAQEERFSALERLTTVSYSGLGNVRLVWWFVRCSIGLVDCTCLKNLHKMVCIVL